jgi:hypothetical protein
VRRWRPQIPCHSDASRGTSKSGQPRSSSLGHLRPSHARSVANRRVRSHAEGADPLNPTIEDRQSIQSVPKHNQAIGVWWTPELDRKRGMLRGAGAYASPTCPPSNICHAPPTKGRICIWPGHGISKLLEHLP